MVMAADIILLGEECHQGTPAPLGERSICKGVLRRTLGVHMNVITLGFPALCVVTRRFLEEPVVFNVVADCCVLVLQACFVLFDAHSVPHVSLRLMCLDGMYTMCFFDEGEEEKKHHRNLKPRAPCCSPTEEATRVGLCCVQTLDVTGTKSNIVILLTFMLFTF